MIVQSLTDFVSATLGRPILTYCRAVINQSRGYDICSQYRKQWHHVNVSHGMGKLWHSCQCLPSHGV